MTQQANMHAQHAWVFEQGCPSLLQSNTQWSLHYADVEVGEDTPRPDLMIRPRIRSWDELLLLSTKSWEGDLVMVDDYTMGKMLTSELEHGCRKLKGMVRQ
jgi:hypothetical protein